MNFTEAMGFRHWSSAAPGTVFLLAVLASPVPALVAVADPTPATPAPSLAPIDDASSPAPVQSGAPGQPKTLGHIYTSVFCRNFVEQFNTAARIIVTNDRHFDDVDVNLRNIENDWNKTDGAMRVFDERNKLIGLVSSMLKSIPVSQVAVNQLLAQANAETDPERKAALHESASQLQKTLDRQRAVTNDLTGVVHVLMDKHTREDTDETNIQYLMLPGMVAHVHTDDDPVDPPGSNTLMQSHATPAPSPSPGSVEDVMQWGRQRSIIATSESRAAVAANRLVRVCNDERPPTAPPSTVPHPAPSPSH